MILIALLFVQGRRLPSVRISYAKRKIWSFCLAVLIIIFNFILQGMSGFELNFDMNYNVRVISGISGIDVMN